MKKLNYMLCNQHLGTQAFWCMANLITGCRILCSIILLFCPAMSPRFIALYLLAGFTDMIDGTVARRTNTVSEFGSRLDTIADFVFIIVCLIKLLPMWILPIWLWIWIGTIFAMKVSNLILGFMIQRHFVAVHTVMNKITGFLLFVLPITPVFIELKYSAVVVCAVATFAAVQEGYFIKSGKIIGGNESEDK